MEHVAAKTIQVQDLPRINEISLVLAKNGFGHLLNLVGIASVLPAGTDQQTGPFARRLRQVLVDLGPTFIKLGQVLSVRPDILPQDVLTEFETLQDKVPPMSLKEVQAVLLREIGKPLEEVFEYIDPEPLGSASMAQVHKAKLIDGSEVALKVQRLDIERRINSDLHILYTLAQLAEGTLTLPGLHTPRAIVREFDQAINRELDFLRELEAARRMLHHFEKTDCDIRIPLVFDQLSTRRLLVMELVEGERLGDLLQTAPPKEANRLAHLIMEGTYLQVFEFGFFHGDPHPGNLFVDHDGKLVYLDFGVVGSLTGAMQETLLSAFTSMVFRDAETLAMTVYRAGANRGRVDLKKFIADLEHLMVEYHGASLDDLANPKTFMEVVELCTRYKISLPAEFAVLSRAITLVEGEIRTLLPRVDIVDEVRPYAQRLITTRFSPERVAHDAAKLMLQAQGHFREFPTQMNQMMMDLQGGNLTIITRDPDAHLVREEIRAAVLRLSLAALASTVTMGSMLFLAAWSPSFTLPYFGTTIPVFGPLGALFLFAGFGLFGALGIHVLFAQFLDLSAWRRRFFAVVRFFTWRSRSSE